MNNELLPVGSIVKIRFAKGKYCIMGFYPKDQKTGKKYQYVAVEYPLGLYDLDDVVAFDGERIRNVVKMGYETEEDKNYRKQVEEEMKAIEGGAQNENVGTPNIKPIEKIAEIERLDEIEKLGE